MNPQPHLQRAAFENAIAAAVLETFATHVDGRRLVVIDPAISIDVLLNGVASILAGSDELDDSDARRAFAGQIGEQLAQRVAIYRAADRSHVVTFPGGDAA